MVSPSPPAQATFYRGWTVLAGGFVCSGLALGGSVYVFGMLVLPISQEFGLSRTSMNTGLIALLIGMAFWGAILGRVVDRLRARLVMALGGICISTGAIGIALAPSLPIMLAATFLLVAAGAVAGGNFAASTVVARWFRRRRGRAMGLMALATSAGGFALPPIFALLVSTQGWRTAVALSGTCVGLLIVAISLLVIRDWPEPGELAAAGELDAELGMHASSQLAEDREWTIGEMLSTADFWLMLFSTSLLIASGQAMLSLAVPFYQLKGVTLEGAAVLLAIQAAWGIVGKISIGFLTERFDVRYIYAAICALHALAMAVLLNWPGYQTMLVLQALLGIGIGGVLPLKLVLTVNIFGSRSFGQVLGAMTVVVQLSSISFIFLSGNIFDQTGSYDQAFTGFMGAAMLALILIMFVRPQVRGPLAYEIEQGKET